MFNTTAKQKNTTSNTSFGAPIVQTTAIPVSNLGDNVIFNYKFDDEDNKYHLAQYDAVKFLEILKNPPVANESLKQLISTFMGK